MKKIIAVFSVILYSILTVSSLHAQRLQASLFGPYNWEQASLRAARENKLVMVMVGPEQTGLEKKLQNQYELMNVLQRKVVAIRIDPDSPQANDFMSHLLMYRPPVIAFFMPYSDLLETVDPVEVSRHPGILREALEKAEEIAQIKRTNSRSIQFTNIPLEKVFETAGEQGKMVFIEAVSGTEQQALLMERNVFRLDKVADFYNEHFINVRLNFGVLEELAVHYKVDRYPAWLFLNERGKVIYRNQGYADAEQFIGYGRMALEKAKGVTFSMDNLEQAQEKARQEHKLIFGVYYSSSRLFEEMKANLFTDPDVSGLVDRHFVSFARQGDKPSLVFYNADGQMVHAVLQVDNPEVLLEEIRLAVADKGVGAMKREFETGNRTPEFIENYIERAGRAGWEHEASQAAAGYLNTLPVDSLMETKYWDMFERHVTNMEPRLFGYVLEHRKQLAGKFGETPVKKKIEALWVAGAEGFVKDSVFDENGFKSYTKRLKKEKVEGWRNIARNARMHAAEKTGDWKTYVNLAEEKWNEEKISDAELYSWGVKINEKCHDEAIRYKAAHWFAWAASEMERKEQVTGKVKLSSYKGFFEKLVNDLIGKK